MNHLENEGRKRLEWWILKWSAGKVGEELRENNILEDRLESVLKVRSEQLCQLLLHQLTKTVPSSWSFLRSHVTVGYITVLNWDAAGI